MNAPEPTEHHFTVPPGVTPPTRLSRPMGARPPLHNLILGSIALAVGLFMTVGSIANIAKGIVAANLGNTEFVIGYAVGLLIIVALLVWGGWLISDYLRIRRRLRG